jgi:hypothetical protein
LFRIHRRQNHAYLTDQIRIDGGGGKHAVNESAIRNADAVARRVDGGCRRSGKGVELCAQCTLAVSGQDAYQIQYVVSDQRQIRNRS